MAKPFIPIGRALCHTDHELTHLNMEFHPNFSVKQAQVRLLGLTRGSYQAHMLSINGLDQDASRIESSLRKRPGEAFYCSGFIESEDFLEDLFPYQPSGNPTFSLHPELTSLEVNNDIFDSEGCNVLSEKLLDLDSTKDLHPRLHDNPLSGSTTYPLLEEFADELPPEYDDNV
nr:hypothetical protein [Tanacetum cinerariifolium]